MKTSEMGNEKSGNKEFRGVLVPVLTPFREDLNPDPGRYVDHCRLLLGEGASGLVPFGTTSEANSMACEERISLLEALPGAGIPGEKLMPGTGCCSVTETVRLTRHAVEMGCGGVLMLPPFYYKDVSEEGLFASFSEVIQQVGDERLRVYLYHIPAQTGVPITIKLIEQLVDAYPDTVIGLKDSGGDWENTAAVIKNFPGLSVFPGSEIFLLRGLRAGAAGCISATANVNVKAIRELFDHWKSAEADALQECVDQFRKALRPYPLIPSLKRIIALRLADPGWLRTRPPLVPLDESATARMNDDLRKIGFSLNS